MTRIKLTIRIPAAQEVMLKRIAEARGLTRYQALGRAIEAGLGVMANAPARSATAVIGDELAAIAVRLGMIEALADRGLFTASAAYAYARRAALRDERDAEVTDAAISATVQSAYQRQRALAREVL